MVGRTWQFVNKSGGPDRRYAQNQKLAICEYGQIELKAADLHVTWHVSNLAMAQGFVRELVGVLSSARGTP